MEDKPLEQDEHRNFKRYSIDGLAVRSEEKHVLGLFKTTPKKHMVLDISKGGIHFISREKFKMAQEFSLEITGKLLKDAPIKAQGKIIRIKEFPGMTAFAIGAEFTAMDDENKERLKMLIKSAAKAKGEISSYIDINATQK
ncbi:MAG: PilZ domain-containing protein [Planctomycetes bacterium]|nr:PilZ domain-containing protein [Planctomycetota bacterium]